MKREGRRSGKGGGKEWGWVREGKGDLTHSSYANLRALAQTHRQTHIERKYSISAIHFVHLAEIIFKLIAASRLLAIAQVS